MRYPNAKGIAKLLIDKLLQGFWRLFSVLFLHTALLNTGKKIKGYFHLHFHSKEWKCVKLLWVYFDISTVLFSKQSREKPRKAQASWATANTYWSWVFHKTPRITILLTCQLVFFPSFVFISPLKINSFAVL